jgi:hypothetical protein
VQNVEFVGHTPHSFQHQQMRRHRVPYGGVEPQGARPYGFQARRCFGIAGTEQADIVAKID